MPDIFDLLNGQKAEEGFLGLKQCIQIIFGADPKRLDAGKPSVRRTFHNMMADSEHTSHAHNTEQAEPFQVDSALSSLKSSE